MNRRFEYGVRLVADRVDGGFVATIPDFPEVITQGDDKAAALAEAADALGSAIATRMRLHEEIPRAPARGRLPVVSVPADVATKAALYIAIREQKLTQKQLAARLRMDEREVRRLLDPRHPSKMPRLESALEALGHAVRIEVVPLARPAHVAGPSTGSGKPRRRPSAKKIARASRRGK